jgi:outer membrane protein TolC
LEESVVNGKVSLEALEKTILSAQQGFKYAQAAYAQAEGRLREGVGTNVELLLALTNVTRARSDLAIAFLNYNRVQANLLFNLGVLTPGSLSQGIQP